MSDDPIRRLNSALEGRYRIERELGQGGMATVYLAGDLKHERKVALKVLKPELAAMVGAGRFLAEIRTTANLRHPHILPLFDSGEADGFVWYAMPWVEGESLRDRIDRERQLPIDEAVAIATRVAGALQAAHDAGVVHRDIKPANILIEKGQPVVADFGIALAVQEAGGGRLTETGLSMGTPYYMSPEQATADRDPDARSDLYSLGCVLYEMLTGEPPHTGATAQAILGRILTGEPRPPTEVRKAVPPNVEAALLQALEKLPADRFGSAQAFADALADPSYRRRTTGIRPGRLGMGSRFGPRDGVTLAVVAIALLGFGWAIGRSGPEAGTAVTPTVTYALVPPQPIDASATALASDGSVAYVPFTAPSRESSVLIKRSDHAGFRLLLGTVGAEDTDFSPDAEQLVFSRRDGVFIVDADGGSEPVRLPDVPFVEGLLWWSPDSILAIRSEAATGAEGVPTILLLIDPNRRRIDTLSTSTVRLRDLAGPTREPGEWYVTSDEGFGRVDLRTGRVETLVPGLAAAQEIAPGLLLYRVGRLLRGSRWDESRGLVGEDLLVADRVEAFDVGPGGDLLLVRWVESEGPDGTETEYPWFPVVWMGEDGSVERIPIPLVTHADPEVSPDGRRLAYVSADRVHVFDMDLGDDVDVTGDLTPVPDGTHNPVWSPDGSQIAFHVVEDEDASIVVVAADGSGLIGRVERRALVWEWLDDRTLLVGAGDGDLFTQDLSEPDAEWVPVLAAPGWVEQSASVSPDGRWLAYISDEDGDFRAYVRSWPELRSYKVMVSGSEPVGGRLDASDPIWSSDSRTLYFVQADEIRSVTFSTSAGALVPGSVTTGLVNLEPGDQVWGLDESTRRFLVFRAGQRVEFPKSEVEVVTGWRRTVVEALSGSGR